MKTVKLFAFQFPKDHQENLNQDQIHIQLY
jgi:hypothetical protein